MVTIKACPICGSTDLGWVGGGANAIYDFTGASSLSGISHCGKCGNNVLPIEFKSEKNYKEFAESLKKEGNKKAKPESMPMAKIQPKSEGINLSQGYSLAYAIIFAAMSLSAFLLYIFGGMAAGLISGIALAVAAAYLYTRRRK